MYSCVMLAFKLLAAFCPEAGPERGHHEGWPQVPTLKAMQVTNTLVVVVVLKACFSQNSLTSISIS